MSVLARMRNQAWSEFEMQCMRVVRHTVERTGSVPKRYQKFIQPRLRKLATLAYTNAIMANEADARTEEGKRERKKLFDAAIDALLRMQKPLVAYWSLFDTSEGGMKEWAEMINKALVLLRAVNGENEAGLPMIKTFDMKYSDDRIFISKMRELHKYTYSKICSVPLEYKDHLSDQILIFVDNALFHVLEGNSSIPENRRQYEIREKHFRKAIDSLNGLQRPLYSLWNVMMYSENVMDEWADQLNQALKLIQGVRKSDRERFGKLK